jgi:hypothetical protein
VYIQNILILFTCRFCVLTPDTESPKMPQTAVGANLL